ncbi:hypothetical protein CMO96_04785 [Candidatus Woesebacteria bacterium]|nr:hypothetical protein [Candidatus Woesebacteria bacterium]|tara:strand:- start:1015 stop:1539 length:525 start_codon:yes stop_codon:yes gene_type:complete
MLTPLQGFIVLLKIIVPSLMLWFPFPAVWANYVLDVLDGDILLELGMEESLYQTIDKVADYFSYIIMLIVGLRWRIKLIVVVLFIYRTIGQALYFLTNNELMFFYFQNFLEPLMMIYALLVFKRGSDLEAFKTYKKHIILIWIIILAYKIWNEWYLHFANIDLSTFFFGVTGGG